MPSSGTLYHISCTPWHFTWQSAHKYTEQFAKRGWDVLFVDPLPKRFPRLSEYKRVIGRIRGDMVQAGKMRQRIVPGVRYFAPRALPDRSAVLRQINRSFLLPSLAQTLSAHAQARPRVALVSLPTRAALDLIDLLRPDILVYLCYLNFGDDDETPRDILETERELTTRADLVLVDEGLSNRDRVASYHPKNPVFHVSATVDYAHFAAAATPVSQPARDGKPRCAYFGTLRPHVDMNLLARVSHHYPLRLIGPGAPPNVSPTTERIPAVAYDRLPAMLRDVDILLLPYQIHDPYNRGVFPAKTFECLATGKPTIAIGLPSLQPFAHVIDIAANTDEFMALLARAEDEVRDPNTPAAAARREARHAVAREHDEAVQAAELFARISEVINTRLGSR